MERPFPTDKPIRGSFTRKGIVRSVVNISTYLVDFGDPDGPTDIAFYSGFDVLTIGSVIVAARMNEAATWRINEIIQLA